MPGANGSDNWYDAVETGPRGLTLKGHKICAHASLPTKGFQAHSTKEIAQSTVKGSSALCS